MLSTTDHALVCPVTLPEDITKSLRQTLAFDIEVLLLEKQMEKIDKEYSFNDNKAMIDKKQKEFMKEKSQIIEEASKLERKLEKLSIAISVFLVKAAKVYQLKNKVFCDAEFVKQLLSYYKDENDKENLTDLFDQEKDELYGLTKEQQDFLNLVRSQSEIHTHHANIMESSKKHEHWNAKLDDHNERLTIFNQTVLRPHNQVIDTYNSLKEQKNAITAEKEQLFKNLLEVIEDDASLTEQLQQLADNTFVLLMKMPELIKKHLRQMLTLDVERLISTQIERTAQRQLDEKKAEIDQKEREFINEKSRLTAELEKINKKQDKINLAVGHFLAKVGKIYKPKTMDVHTVAKMIKDMLFSYRDKNGNMNAIDLFDESKDDAHHLTPEQKEFLNFLRNQNEAKVHYANKLESNKKGEEHNDKINDYNARLNTLKKTLLNDYNQAVKNYNTLKEKIDELIAKKEQVCKDFLKMIEEDADLQEPLEQFVDRIKSA